MYFVDSVEADRRGSVLCGRAGGGGRGRRVGGGRGGERQDNPDRLTGRGGRGDKSRVPHFGVTRVACSCVKHSNPSFLLLLLLFVCTLLFLSLFFLLFSSSFSSFFLSLTVYLLLCLNSSWKLNSDTPHEVASRRISLSEFFYIHREEWGRGGVGWGGGGVGLINCNNVYRRCW